MRKGALPDLQVYYIEKPFYFGIGLKNNKIYCSCFTFGSFNKFISLFERFGNITEIKENDFARKIFNVYLEKENFEKIRDLLDLSGYREEEVKLFYELRKVKFGETISYKELGAKLKMHPRKVGLILRKNRFELIFPCHRVIKSNGEIGKFRGREDDDKRKILEFEKMYKYVHMSGVW